MWRRLGIALVVDLALIAVSLWGWSRYDDDGPNPWWVPWSLVVLTVAAAVLVGLIFCATVLAAREFRAER
jgi:hypothetical protein